MIRTFLILAVLLVLAGCASAPPPLPGARPEALPEAWLGPLREAPCPPALSAHVRLRIDPPDRGAVRLDGDLRASLPDTIRLSGRVGVFRPIFQFLSVAGFAELLLHESRSYWIVPSDEPDWEVTNPAALRQAILWSLCPTTLLRSFRAADRGRMVGRTWQVAGELVGTPHPVRLYVEPRSRSVREIHLGADEDLRLVARLDDYVFLGSAWLPQTIELEIPGPDGATAIVIGLSGLELLDPGATEREGLVQPPGWRHVEGLPLTLPADLGSGDSGP